MDILSLKYPLRLIFIKHFDFLIYFISNLITTLKSSNTLMNWPKFDMLLHEVTSDMPNAPRIPYKRTRITLSSRFSLTSRLIYLLLLLICFNGCAQGQFILDRPIPSLHRQSSYIHPQRLLTSSVSFYDDTLINTHTDNDQMNTAVAVLKNGGFVVTWQSKDQDGSGAGIYAQMFDATGAPSGSEFQVNTFTSGDQSNPDICALEGGKFVITWQSVFQDGNSWGVYMQMYNADGSAFGSEVQVNEYTNADQSAPAITGLQNGGFVITWHSLNQIGSDFEIYARIFNADGTVKIGEFLVNSVTSGAQTSPSIASSPDSSFIITWQDGPSGSKDVRARMFSASGGAKGADFVVNTYTNNDQDSQAIATFPDSSFIITWRSKYQIEGGIQFYSSDIYFQRYNADGSLNGQETRANTYTATDQLNPSVATLSSTSFIITWTSDQEDGSGSGVYAQRFNEDGTKKGIDFQVNTVTNNDQAYSRVKAFQGNSFVLVWVSSDQDKALKGIFGTIFMDCDATLYMKGPSCVPSCPSHYYASSVNYRCEGNHITIIPLLLFLPSMNSLRQYLHHLFRQWHF